MITIEDFKFYHPCEFNCGAKPYDKRYSVGDNSKQHAYRKIFCPECLKGIVEEGLKILTEEERNKILSQYEPLESPTIGVNEQGNTNTLQEDKNPSIDLKTLPRKKLLSLAKEKGVGGKLVTMKTEDLIKAIKEKEDLL